MEAVVLGLLGAIILFMLVPMLARIGMAFWKDIWD